MIHRYSTRRDKSMNARFRYILRPEALEGRCQNILPRWCHQSLAKLVNKTRPSGGFVVTILTTTNYGYKSPETLGLRFTVTVTMVGGMASTNKPKTSCKVIGYTLGKSWEGPPKAIICFQHLSP